MLSTLANQEINDNNFSSLINYFFDSFDIKAATLKKLNFYKQTGIPVLHVLKTIFTLIFTSKNWWRTCKDSNNDIKKDVVYRFLNNSTFEWEAFLLELSIKIISVFKKLTSEKRVSALIFDDTFFDRMRSKSVELLSKIFDHVDMRYKKGFCNLTCGWTDGYSFVPVMFQMVCSVKSIINKMNKTIKSKCAINRRENAQKKKTDLLIEMVDRAINKCIPFSYVLFDSWFAFPSMFVQLFSKNVRSISMLKNHPKIFYQYNDAVFTLSNLYAKIKHKLKKDRDKTSSIVKISSSGLKIDVKIVFIRDKRSKKNWVALLSTDTSIDENEVIRIYGMRWEIEVFFKMCKSYLKFAKEFQGRSYDMLTAHTTIVYLRYMMFSVLARESNDQKTFGDLFYACVDEIKTITFWQAFKIIIELLKQFLKDKMIMDDQVIEDLLNEFIDSLPVFFALDFRSRKCES
jgi:hypothetical protein